MPCSRRRARLSALPRCPCWPRRSRVRRREASLPSRPRSCRCCGSAPGWSPEVRTVASPTLRDVSLSLPGVTDMATTTQPGARVHGVPMSDAHDWSDPRYQAFMMLRIGFAALPIVFGLDKFLQRARGLVAVPGVHEPTESSRVAGMTSCWLSAWWRSSRVSWWRRGLATGPTLSLGDWQASPQPAHLFRLLTTSLCATSA